MKPQDQTPKDLDLEKTGLEFLRNGKFRKARDAFKALNKSQPSRALPLLIEANLGLANEMMAKGLVSEANQVLAYLKTIAPASCDLTLVTPAKAKNRDAWSLMVPLAARRLAAGPPPDDRIRAADEMILGAESPQHPGHPDAEAILQALDLGYGAAAAAQTTPLIRSVPRSSPFSHWVFFFKGMTALEAGAHARAADFFRRIPANSLLQASIPALLTLCGAPPAPQPAPRNVHALCAWAGHPEFAEPLLQAEPLWRKNRRAKAFTLLTKKIPNLLCFGARGFKADLSRFLTTEFINAHLQESDYCDTLLDYIAIKSRNVARAVVDQSFFTINLADYSQCAHRHFQTAVSNLDGISRVAPISPAMLSRIFTRLAESYIASVKKNPDDLCSPPNAKKALEQAIKHDPDHLHAWLTQCDLLSMGNDTSAYHRFLDDLSKRFPTEKEVLIRNGECCIGRGSHTKALRNFEKAAKIDSVDPRIARGILRARLGIAEASYKKRQFFKVNWDLIDSLASNNKNCPEFPLWRLRVHRLVLDARHNMMAEQLFAIAAAALPLAPNAFRFEIACRIGIGQHDLRFNAGVLEKILPTRLAPQSLTDFLAVIDEVEMIEDDASYDNASTTALIIFNEHQSRLLEFLTDRKDLDTLLIRIFSCRKPKITLASAAIQMWFSRAPSDPVLCHLCMNYSFPWLPERPDEDLEDIETDLRDSQNPDHRRLLMLFERNRRRIMDERYGNSRKNHSLKLDLDYDPHGAGGEYDEYDEYDEDFEDEHDDGMSGALEAVGQAIAKMSPTERRAVIEEILGLGMDGPVDPISNRPPPGKPPAKRLEPDPDPFLFDMQSFPPPKP